MSQQPTTEQQFFAEYDEMKTDLAHARQEILLLSNQLRDANTENEKLSYKCDFLTSEVTRITASRDQYQRVSVRLAGKMDGALDAWTAMADAMKNEIRDAAFTKIPGTAATPEPPARPTYMAAASAEEEFAGVAEIGRKFGAGFNTNVPRAVKS